MCLEIAAPLIDLLDRFSVEFRLGLMVIGLDTKMGSELRSYSQHSISTQLGRALCVVLPIDFILEAVTLKLSLVIPTGFTHFLCIYQWVTALAMWNPAAMATSRSQPAAIVLGLGGL